MLEGKYSIRYGEKTVVVKARDFVFISKGTSHNYQSGPEDGRVFVISLAGLEGYFAGVADVLRERPITWEMEQEIAEGTARNSWTG